MANKNQQLNALLRRAASALKDGRRAMAKNAIREAYRAICTPATEVEIHAARLLHETDDVEVDMDAVASHVSPEEGYMGVWVQAWVWVGKPAAVCHFPGCETVMEGDDFDLFEHAAAHQAGASAAHLQRLRDNPLSFFDKL